MAAALVDREPEEMEVRDWDGRARIRYMTGADRLKYLSSLGTGNGDDNVRGFNAMIRLVQWTLVDERGERIFTDDDFDMVSSMPLLGLRKVAERAGRMNGFNVEEDEVKSEPSPS
jgi:hypothetical protein